MRANRLKLLCRKEFLSIPSTTQFTLLNQIRQTTSFQISTQTTMAKQINSHSNLMILIVSKIVALLLIKTSFTFMVVQIILIKSSNLIVMKQKCLPVSNLILSVELVQVTIITYFSAFQLKIIDCVTSQKIHYLKNGGSGLHTQNFRMLLMIQLPCHQVIHNFQVQSLTSNNLLF